MPVLSLPAPYGGQNNRDGVYNLAPEFATSLVNWIPGPGYLDARGPCTAASVNTAGLPIQSIWRHPGGNSVFSTTNGDIYLAQSTIGAAITGTPTNGDFHGNTFQDRLILCNGVNVPQVYDGTNVANADYTGSPGSLTATNLYGSMTFKGRVYYWEAAKRLFWYAAAGSFQGPLALFDLSTFARSDGYLVSIAPLTFDGGSGPDDLIAFLFSSGEVLVYQGDDPSNTNSWQQVGAFRIGSMIGRSCWAVVGSSTLVATALGTVDLARALSVGPVDDSATAGQYFGTINFSPPSLAFTERKLAFDPYNRILWVALIDMTAISTATNMVALHGMDTESRSWFTTLDIAYGTGSGSGNATAFVTTPSGLLFGASTTGRLIGGPNRSVTGPVTNDIFTSGPLTYSAIQCFPLDSPDRNKQLSGLAFQMQQVSSDSPSATATYTVSSEAGGSSGALTMPNVLVRQFSHAPAYGTRLFVSTTVTSKSGLRWFGTDLLVKPGRQV